MRLTPEQVAQMQQKGLSMPDIERIAAQKGYQMPDSRDHMQKATDFATSFAPGRRVGEAIGTLGGLGVTAAKEKLGMVPEGTTGQFDISAPSPLQVAGDVAAGATAVAGAGIKSAASLIGKTAQFAGLGAASGASNAIANADSLAEAGAEAQQEGFKSALIGLSFGVLGKAAGAASKVAQKAGETIQYKVIKPHQADLEDGFDIKTLQKYDLGGSLKDTAAKTQAKLDDLSKQLTSKLASSNASLDLNRIYDNTVRRMLGAKLESFGSNTQTEAALERLRNEIIAVSGQNGLVSIPEAQIVKRAAGHFGAWQFGNVDPDAKASERIYNTFYNEMKKAIEEASPEGVRELNKQMSELIPVMNAVLRRIPVAERNNPISLTDIITLTGATLEPRALTLSLVNMASKSGKVGDALANVKGGTQKAIDKAAQVARSAVSY